MHTFSIGQLRHLHSNTSCTQPARHIRGTQSHFDISRKTQESSAAAPSAARTQLLKLASAACLFLAPAQVHAADSTTLSFNKNCIGCHVGGGNVVQSGATLKMPDLQRNGAASVEAIYDLVYSGKGKMPGYGAGCTPKGKCTFGPRLSDDEIQRLSQYVVQQAEQGWQ